MRIICRNIKKEDCTLIFYKMQRIAFIGHMRKCKRGSLR
jgi:hypothetical protein